MFKSMIQKTTGIRRAGSAALDLAYVASGALDGFGKLACHPGILPLVGLLIQEAGGIVTDLSGQSGWLTSGNILVSSQKFMMTCKPLLQAIFPRT